MAETYGITEFSWNRLMQTLHETHAVSRAILFGSRALGRARRGSDIDIAIEGQGASNLVALDLAGRLNEREPIPYFVDVVALGSLTNQDLISHIERVGKVIYAKDSETPGT